MANWQRKLRLWPEWDKADAGKITVQELAQTVARRLRSLSPFNIEYVDSERDEIAEEFEHIANDPSTDTDDFDHVMDRLYDWADTQIGGAFFDAKKVCWIDRFAPQGPTP